MARYSYIPPEYKTNTNNMSTTTHPTTAAGTQLNYNDAAKNRALDYSAQPTSKSTSNLPLYWSSPSPWELEVAMAASQAKPKRKPKPLLFISPSPWEYEVAMLVSEPKTIPKPLPKRKPEPEPLPEPSPRPSRTHPSSARWALMTSLSHIKQITEPRSSRTIASSLSRSRRREVRWRRL